MRPHRVRLTHSLVANYGLNQKMYVHRPEPRTPEELEQFHCDGAHSPWAPFWMQCEWVQHDACAWGTSAVLLQ